MRDHVIGEGFDYIHGKRPNVSLKLVVTYEQDETMMKGVKVLLGIAAFGGDDTLKDLAFDSRFAAFCALVAHRNQLNLHMQFCRRISLNRLLGCKLSRRSITRERGPR